MIRHGGLCTRVKAHHLEQVLDKVCERTRSFLNHHGLGRVIQQRGGRHEASDRRPQLVCDVGRETPLALCGFVEFANFGAQCLCHIVQCSAELCDLVSTPRMKPSIEVAGRQATGERCRTAQTPRQRRGDQHTENRANH